MLPEWLKQGDAPQELVFGWPRSVLLGDEKLIVEQQRGAQRSIGRFAPPGFLIPPSLRTRATLRMIPRLRDCRLLEVSSPAGSKGQSFTRSRWSLTGGIPKR